MCNWVNLLYSRKLTEHCKPAIMEKNKNHYIKKTTVRYHYLSARWIIIKKPKSPDVGKYVE